MLLYGTFTTLSSIPLPNPVSPHPASPPPRPIPRTLLNPPTALPVIYTSVAMSCIRSLSVLRLPPTPHHLGSDAVYVVTGAYDGSTKIVDVRDPLVPIPLDRQRCKSRSFSPSFFFQIDANQSDPHTHTQYRSCPPHGLPISQGPSWAITNTLPKSYGLRIGKAVHAGLSFPDIGVSSGLGLFSTSLSICTNETGRGG